MGDLTVAGFLEHCPFNGENGTEIFVCSEALFTKLTGETDYTIIDIQTERKAGEITAEKLRELAGNEFLLSDNRLSNQSIKGAYYQQYLHECVGAVETVRCDAGGGNGYEAGKENALGGNRYLCSGGNHCRYFTGASRAQVFMGSIDPYPLE